MGISIAPSEMQHFAGATVKLVEAAFPGTRGIAYLDDLFFLARHPDELVGEQSGRAQPSRAESASTARRATLP